jgi:hypothetical protein
MMRRDMTPNAKKAGKARSRKIATGTYRGVRIQAVSDRSNFTRDQIRKAVEAAIAKNAHALTSRD